MRQLRSTVLALLLVPAATHAGSYTATPPVQASGPSPFAACTADQPYGSTVYAGSAWAPVVAVNPTNPANIVGAWLQDRFADRGGRGAVVGVSTDGGGSWTTVPLPGITKCEGGIYDRAGSSGIAFGPTGVAYVIGTSFVNTSPLFPVNVSRSTDGGHTWSSPATLILDDSQLFGNRIPSIAVDPHDPSLVYATWSRIRLPEGAQAADAAEASAAFRFDVEFARSTDGGLHWEPARAAWAPLSNSGGVGCVVAVLPDGSVLIAFNRFDGGGAGAPNQIAVIRSTDHGQTWSAPVKVSDFLRGGVADPETGAPVLDTSYQPDVGVDPVDGTVYVVWGDPRFGGKAGTLAIVMSKSTDGGLTWTAPAAVNQTPSGIPEGNRQAFRPTVEVAADHTVGVSYYDLRSNTADPATLFADCWFVHSHNGGASWSETHVSRPFDLAKAPTVRGARSLGDLQGLAVSGASFKALFGRSDSGTPLSVQFSSIGP